MVDEVGEDDNESVGATIAAVLATACLCMRLTLDTSLEDEN